MKRKETRNVHKKIYKHISKQIPTPHRTTTTLTIITHKGNNIIDKITKMHTSTPEYTHTKRLNHHLRTNVYNLNI